MNFENATVLKLMESLRSFKLNHLFEMLSFGMRSNKLKTIIFELKKRMN